VDKVVNLFPPMCLGCGHALREELDAAPCRYQQLELRDHRLDVTEWRCHEVECERCGAATQAKYNRTKIPSSVFGPCLTAVVALLTGAYHLSRRKTQRLLSELLGISISLGTISAMERRSSNALKACHEEALLEVQRAGVKHTIPVNVKKRAPPHPFRALGGGVNTVLSKYARHRHATNVVAQLLWGCPA
jgi:transposase